MSTMRKLASTCHSCSICSVEDKKPNSAFGKTMRWHRRWCPAYAAHKKIYGEKSLSRQERLKRSKWA